MKRFIKAVALGDLGDHFGVQTASTTIAAVTDIPGTGLSVTGAQTLAAASRQAIAMAKLNSRNSLINGPARRNLHNEEVDGDNRPQRRDNQQ
ncbi:hypothetical protein D3C72_1689250 [compost metagenome]